MTKKQMDRRLLVFFYILAFILLREWLVPVMELTDTGYFSIFLLFVVLSFGLSLARMKWFISNPLKFVFVFWAIHYMYIEKMQMTVESSKGIVVDLISNFGIIVTGDWENITSPFRTLLFFVLLWMTTYLIQYWMESRKSIFLFYLMTVIFIAFIDTFSEYSANGAIIRIMVIGLLLLGLLYILKLSDTHKTPISPTVFAAFSVPLLFMVVASGVFAQILPKKEPIWPDPVPFLQSLVTGSGSGGLGHGPAISKSGYDPDDSRLGGDFVEDDSLVFEAAVARKQYWKIETKNTYTSKGWEQLPKPASFQAYASGEEMDDFEVTEGITVKESRTADIHLAMQFPFLVYPYGMTKAVAEEEEASFFLSEEIGMYNTYVEGNLRSLSNYELEFLEHDYSLKMLRETSLDSISTEDFAEYLQLPEQLPERVHELAATITENSTNVYDKTKDIERYFGRSGFVYDRRNVAIPSAEDDYVDQFLFDTKRGYCDNFSSSMVVMLRTIGIPARWVKGFAPGEIGENDAGESVYVITNNEAHSWVEAYMPGIGWMPFEPTIGFSNQSRINYDLDLSETDPAVPEMKQQERDQLEEKKPTPVAKPKKDLSFLKVFGTAGTWVKVNIWKIILYVGLVTLTTWLIFKYRSKWLPKLLIISYRFRKHDWNLYTKQYKSLLKQLERFGIKRRSGTTLSVYAEQVDRVFGDDIMRRLTAAYEKGLYGGEKERHNWEELQEMWKDLINRSSG